MASCCCSCAEPVHHRDDHAERCHRCGKHRPPRGRIRFMETPEDAERELVAWLGGDDADGD